MTVPLQCAHAFRNEICVIKLHVMRIYYDYTAYASGPKSFPDISLSYYENVHPIVFSQESEGGSRAKG